MEWVKFEKQISAVALPPLRRLLDRGDGGVRRGRDPYEPGRRARQKLRVLHQPQVSDHIEARSVACATSTCECEGGKERERMKERAREREREREKRGERKRESMKERGRERERMREREKERDVGEESHQSTAAIGFFPFSPEEKCKLHCLAPGHLGKLFGRPRTKTTMPVGEHAG